MTLPPEREQRRWHPLVRVARRSLLWAAQTAVCTGLGALTWLWWLRRATPVGDYSTAEVTACAATLAILCLALPLVVNPVAVGLGITAGFWLLWTRHATSEDPTGLYLVGSALLLAALAAGTLLFTTTGAVLAQALHSRRYPVNNSS